MHTTFFSPFTNANSSLITTPPPPQLQIGGDGWTKKDGNGIA